MRSRKIHKFFLFAGIGGILLFFSVASAKMMGLKSAGTVRHEKCSSNNIFIIREGSENTDSWPYRVPEPPYCIHIYLDNNWYDQNYIYYTLPQEARRTSEYFNTPPESYGIKVLDSLNDGDRAYFVFPAIAWSDQYIPIEYYNQFAAYPFGSEPAIPPVNLTNLPKIYIPPAIFSDPVLTDFEPYKNPFPDTHLSSLEGMAAAELYRRTVANGYEYLYDKYPGGQFLGDREVNRAEGAKFLLRTRFGDIEQETLEIETLENKFPDVYWLYEGKYITTYWYGKYVAKASIEGVIQGYPDGLFRPEQGINRAEFLKMISKTFQLEENLSHTYGDVDPDAWYAKYAGIAQKYQMFPGEAQNNSLFPGKKMTRNEVAVAIYQYLKMR